MNQVLLVDDDDDFREALDAALKQQGYRVEHAGNGREALARLSRAQPDAILVDLMMPVMDGWHLLAALASDPQLAGIPVAVLSAARKPAGLPSHAVLLAKPFSLRSVLDFLADASKRRPT
jgi:CheY-like chemotaxis protein